MSATKKPYIRRKSNSKFIAIFNTQNREFAPLLVTYCHTNGIGCILEKTTPTGHDRYVVSGRISQIEQAKEYIKTAYNEFLQYNKEVSRYIKK